MGTNLPLSLKQKSSSIIKNVTPGWGVHCSEMSSKKSIESQMWQKSLTNYIANPDKFKKGNEMFHFCNPYNWELGKDAKCKTETPPERL